MEFRNDSGASFHGAEGRILPGHKFYLVGKLGFTDSNGNRLKDRNGNPLPDGSKVFARDCYTEAACLIKTFKNAHSAVPDMGIPQLSLGVETEINWVLTDPTTVMLE